MRARIILPELRGKADLQAALDALTAFDRTWRMAHPGAPKLYDAGVRYEREWPREEWLTLPILLSRKRGDCEDLAAARAAEIPGARAVALRVKNGWHIVVRLPDGSLEDPSRRLGM